jgi:hypothetical protein
MKHLASLIVLAIAVGMLAVPGTASADHLGYPHVPGGGVKFGPNGYVAVNPAPVPVAPAPRFETPYRNFGYPYRSPYYVVPVPPPTWVWQPGWWNWNGQQWSWTPSHWVQVHPY